MALTTTYLGHDIEIEPFEWGYLAHIFEPRSNARFVAVSSSAFKALEDAFDAIDDGLRGLERVDEHHQDDQHGDEHDAEGEDVEALEPLRPEAHEAAAGPCLGRPGRGSQPGPRPTGRRHALAPARPAAPYEASSQARTPADAPTPDSNATGPRP